MAKRGENEWKARKHTPRIGSSGACCMCSNTDAAATPAVGQGTMSPSLTVSSPSLRCAAIVAILLSGVLPDILLKLAAATCSTCSSSSDPSSFSRSANFHPDFAPKSWTSLTCETTQKTIAGGKKNSPQLSSGRNSQYKFTLRPRTLCLFVCVASYLCASGTDARIPLSFAFTPPQLRRKYRCTDRSLLQYFHTTSTASVLCILLGVRLPTTTKNKQSINSPY